MRFGLCNFLQHNVKCWGSVDTKERQVCPIAELLRSPGGQRESEGATLSTSVPPSFLLPCGPCFCAMEGQERGQAVCAV